MKEILLTSSVLILALLLLRLLFRKTISRRVQYALWGLVALRLLVPVSLPAKWYLVAVPPVHVSTALIFQDPDLVRNTPKQSWTELRSGSWKNDCEPLVKKQYPEVAKALSWLLEYAPSRMTGTGACVFAEFADEKTAREALAEMPDWLQGFVAKGLTLSPLQTVLQQVQYEPN